MYKARILQKKKSGSLVPSSLQTSGKAALQPCSRCAAARLPPVQTPERHRPCSCEVRETQQTRDLP